MNSQVGFGADISRAEAVKRKFLLKGLIDHPGWQVYMQILKEQQDIRVADLLEPAMSQDDLIAKQYRTGAAWAFKAAQELGPYYIEYCDGVIASANRTEEAGNTAHPITGEDDED